MELCVYYDDMALDIDVFAEKMRQLGRCDAGMHGRLSRCMVMFDDSKQHEEALVCQSCRKAVDENGATIKRHIFSVSLASLLERPAETPESKEFWNLLEEIPKAQTPESPRFTPPS